MSSDYFRFFAKTACKSLSNEHPTAIGFQSHCETRLKSFPKQALHNCPKSIQNVAELDTACKRNPSRSAIIFVIDLN
jgi:hypothetical protein